MTAFACQAAETVTDVLPALAMPPGGFGAFNTPIDTYKGAIYTVNVEYPSGVTPTVLNLLTVIRKGVQGSGGSWQWTSTVLEARTGDDPWHTQPSIGIDKNGYVHVAYNMHNLPWQYAVSDQPGEIRKFTFRGEPLTMAQLEMNQIQNRQITTTFGSAAIPGTLITAPAFFKDRGEELYVTYRFGAKPKLSHAQVVWAGGIAHYKLATKTWEAVGGAIPVTAADGDTPAGQTAATSVVAFAATPGLWVNNLRLHFDIQNRMHAVFDWENYMLGDNRDLRYNYAVSNDGGRSFSRQTGEKYTLPITSASGEEVVHLPVGVQAGAWILSDAGGNLGIITAGVTPPYPATIYTPASGRWLPLAPSPWGALRIIQDAKRGLLAVATGPVIFRADSGLLAGPWRKIYSESDGWSYPRMLATDTSVFVHLQRCQGFSSRTLPGTTPSRGTCQVRILQVKL